MLCKRYRADLGCAARRLKAALPRARGARGKLELNEVLMMTFDMSHCVEESAINVQLVVPQQQSEMRQSRTCSCKIVALGRRLAASCLVDFTVAELSRDQEKIGVMLDRNSAVAVQQQRSLEAWITHSLFFQYLLEARDKVSFLLDVGQNL